MKALNKLFVVLFLSAVVMSCDDEESGTTTDFGTIASTYYEEAGDESIFVPFRNSNGSITAEDISFSGTAKEGEDFTIGEVTAEGVTVNLKDDLDAEIVETIKLTINGVEGNNKHTISIVSDDPGFMDIDLTWSLGEGGADMDLLLWWWDEEHQEWVDISQSWGSTFEHLAVDFSDDDGKYGLSYNYFDGPDDQDNDFTVTFTPQHVLVDGGTEPLVFNATMTPANIAASSDYPVLQTFEKNGPEFTEFSEITVPEEGSRVKVLRAKLAEAVAAKYKAAKQN